MKDNLQWSARKLKSVAAREMQKAIRMEAANDEGMCHCVTCGRLEHFKKMHAGHFIAGRTNAILFDERGIHPQCVRCNTFENGKPLEYEQWMLEQYGAELVNELREQKNRTVEFTRGQLCQMRAAFRKRIKDQERRLGA